MDQVVSAYNSENIEGILQVLDENTITQDPLGTFDPVDQLQVELQRLRRSRGTIISFKLTPLNKALNHYSLNIQYEITGEAIGYVKFNSADENWKIQELDLD